MISHDQIMFRDYASLWSLTGRIPIVVTEGKTYVLSEQSIDTGPVVEAEIKIEEVKAGKIILPRTFIKVKSSEVYRKSKDLGSELERVYDEIAAGFILIEQDIVSKFIEALPDGKGGFYQLSSGIEPAGENTWAMVNEIAMVWTEKIRRTL